MHFAFSQSGMYAPGPVCGLAAREATGDWTWPRQLGERPRGRKRACTTGTVCSGTMRNAIAGEGACGTRPDALPGSSKLEAQGGLPLSRRGAPWSHAHRRNVKRSWIGPAVYSRVRVLVRGLVHSRARALGATAPVASCSCGSGCTLRDSDAHARCVPHPERGLLRATGAAVAAAAAGATMPMQTYVGRAWHRARAAQDQDGERRP